MNNSRDKMRKTLQGMQIADEFEDFMPCYHEAVQWLLEQEQAQAEKIEKLEGAIKASDERLVNASIKIKRGIYVGCDTPDMLSDVILAQDVEIEKLKKENHKRKESDWKKEQWMK